MTGERMFKAFPDNPDQPDADGAGNLFASFQLVTNNAKPHYMAVQRHDARRRERHFPGTSLAAGKPAHIR